MEFLDKIQIRIFSAIFFLSIYAITSIISNALYSITLTTLGAIVLYVYKAASKDTIRFIYPEKSFLLVYLPFFILIIASSIGIGYKDSISKAIDITSWSLVPFLLYYFSMQRVFFHEPMVLGIISGSWTLGIYGLYQYIYSDSGRIQSYLSQPNYLAEMIEMSIPFLFLYVLQKSADEKIKIVSIITGSMLVILLFMTKSRGGILGLIAGGSCLFFIRCILLRIETKQVFKYFVALLIVACGTIIFFYSQHTSQNENVGITRSYDYERILLWESSYDMWKNHRAFGIGLRHWHDEYISKYISPDAKEPNLEFPHNIYMYFISETGTLGGVGILFFTVGVFFYFVLLLKRNPDNIFVNAFIWSFLIIMIHGQVDAGITNKFVMRLYSTYLGITLASVVYYNHFGSKEYKGIN